MNGSVNRIATDKTRATTPPSLLGIDRRIAYANKKYHSGWICGGVTIGFAGVKFSGSIRSLGFKKHSMISAINNSLNPTMSLNVKYGWNGLFLHLGWDLVDLVSKC